MTGVAPLRIMRSHVLPNILGPVMVLATIQVATAIITEATLSFLGVGVPPTTPSWGRMLSEASSIFTAAWLRTKDDSKPRWWLPRRSAWSRSAPRWRRCCRRAATAAGGPRPPGHATTSGVPPPLPGADPADLGQAGPPYARGAQRAARGRRAAGQAEACRGAARSRSSHAIDPAPALPWSGTTNANLSCAGCDDVFPPPRRSTGAGVDDGHDARPQKSKTRPRRRLMSHRRRTTPTTRRRPTPRSATR